MADTSSASVAASTTPSDVSPTTNPSSTSGTPAPIAQFAKVHGRMPSLTQLAARMGTEKLGQPNASSVSSRPRLATTLLRTGSSVSLSTNDSLAVNAPTTRSGSPSNVTVSSRSTSPARSAAGAAVPGGDDQLTAEKLEKLNSTEGTEKEKEKEKKVKGYKNTPSLEAITARLGLARSLSIDGTAKPPEPETYEDPKTPGVPQKAEEHRLQYQWTIYHDSKAKFPYTPSHGSFNGQQAAAAPTAPVPVETDTYEAGLTVIGEFNTVESFCRYFNWLKPPSQLERNSNYHLFKTGIKPMWEDPANANGGKWVLTMKNSPQLLDRCWSWLAMGLVGQELEDEDEICGAVVSLRSKVDRIQVWIRSKDDVEKVNSIGRKLVKILDVSETDGIGLEFQYNSDDRPPPNKFLSIHASFPQSGFRSSFTHGHGHSGSFSGDTSMGAPNSAGLNQPAPQGVPNANNGGSAFGAFGNAGGGFSGGGWRGRK